MGEAEGIRHNVDVLVKDGASRRSAGGSKRGAASILHRRRHCVVYPGFVNCHHHLYQTLTRNIPKVQNAKLFDWLVGLYEVWRELAPEAVKSAPGSGSGSSC